MSKAVAPLSTHQQAKDLATDLQLLQLFSNPVSMSTSPLGSAVKNVGALSKLLHHKNAKYSYTHQQRQRDQLWVINKKADLLPLIRRVEAVKTQFRNIEKEKQKEVTNLFYTSPQELVEQSTFIAKSLKYLQYNLIQDMFNEADLPTCPTQKKSRALQSANIQMQIPQPKLTPQPKKQPAYIKSIRQLFATGSSGNINHNFIESFQANVQSELWTILGKLLSSSGKDKVKRSLFHMAIQSLELVEAELDLILPNNFQSIISFLETHYLRKVPGKYEMHGSMGPVWAIAYMLYRAGRHSQFYEYLPDPQFRRMFRTADEAILNRRPIKINDAEQNNDIFHDQLVYALSGTSKYSNEHLCDPNSLDIAWIFLRNVGIFPDNESKFRELQSDIFNSYNANPQLSCGQLKNLLYLLCFDELISIGPNQLIDNNDYVHLLISLYHLPGQLPLINQDLLGHKLVEYLAQYIQALLGIDDQASVFYASLMPTDSLCGEISSLLVSTSMIFKFKWALMRKLINSSVFEELVRQTCDKWTRKFGDHIMVAQLLQDLIQDYPTALLILVKFGLLYLSGGKGQKSEFNRCLSMSNSIVKKDQKLRQEYTPLLILLHEHQSLRESLETRNPSSLLSTLSCLQEKLVSSNLSISLKSLLDKLIQLNSLDSYMQYMKDVAKGHDICYTKMGKNEELQQFYRQTLDAAVGISGSLPVTDGFSQLVAVLEDGLYRYH